MDEATTALERAIRTNGRPWRWRAGQMLVREGDASGAVVLIEHGSVKVVSHTTGGGENVHALLGGGDVVGELAALDGSPHAASAVALGAGDGLRIGVAEFRRLIHHDIELMLELAQLLATRVRGADRVRNDLGSGDVDTRVALWLCHLVDAASADAVGELRITITQDDLARWCGASRQAVNTALGRLRAAGVLRTGRGHVVVVDRAALRDRATA